MIGGKGKKVMKEWMHAGGYSEAHCQAIFGFALLQVEAEDRSHCRRRESSGC